MITCQSMNAQIHKMCTQDPATQNELQKRTSACTCRSASASPGAPPRIGTSRAWGPRARRSRRPRCCSCAPRASSGRPSPASRASWTRRSPSPHRPSSSVPSSSPRRHCRHRRPPCASAPSISSSVPSRRRPPRRRRWGRGRRMGRGSATRAARRRPRGRRCRRGRSRRGGQFDYPIARVRHTQGRL